MKRSFLIQLFLLSGLALFGAPAARSQAIQTPAPQYNRSTQMTVSGIVQSISQFRGRTSVGTHIMLKTSQGDFDVRLGPSWFLQQQNVNLAKGDNVQVTGSKQVIGGQNILLAREITKNGETAILRNPQGFPLWSGRMGGQNGMMNNNGSGMQGGMMRNGNGMMHGGMMGNGYGNGMMQGNCPGMQGYGNQNGNQPGNTNQTAPAK